ncbi:hypothetical protein E0Z10_g3882 [Xylaria hypoxylon]|uniref:Uncharacterized protein n=1 Tax=Xylaria hypoxylon TaxID=37992 RepID=A0A4Z0YKQ2_9PEZI|nr:hypothetical protein E0Z10_g3882 [Xylaria hypoxylon]
MGSSLNSAETAPGLTPVSGATLFRREIERRESLHCRGVVPTGCPEIDDALLLGGGFERGCVVGISTEEVDFGLLLGLQTIARALVFEGSPTTSRGGSATIITTLPVTIILPFLRDVIRSQVQIKLGPRHPGIDVELRRCLEVISISRIFDIEGLWEVLHELDEAQVKANFRHSEDRNEETTSHHVPDGDKEDELESVESAMESLASEGSEEKYSREEGSEKARVDLADNTPPRTLSEPTTSSPGSEPVTQLPPLRIGPELRPLARKYEILDSEDEEPFSSSPLSSPPPSTVAPDSLSPSEEHPQPPAELDSHPTSTPDLELEVRPRELEVPLSISVEKPPPPAPDIVIVTHFSALLTTLFTRSDKTSAHTNLQLLSSKLRHLALSAGPLIMLLNTTTSPSPEISTSVSSAPGPLDANHPITPAEATKQQRPLDATLRSIFNPGQQLHSSNVDQRNKPGYGYGHSYNAAASRLTRRNKPSFGVSFAQFLDLHLLCTKVPRTRDDAETAVALGAGSEGVRYAWVVEALLDERGVWEWGKVESRKGAEKDRAGDTRLPPRVNREQRWAAVDVLDGVKIVNAFSGSGSGSGSVNRGPVRIAAGFGGPRV